MATFSLYDQVIEDKNLNDQPIGMQITSKEYQHNIVTSKTNPLTGVLTRISGSSYTVDYYSQQLGGNTELRDFDPTQSSIYQDLPLAQTPIVPLFVIFVIQVRNSVFLFLKSQ